jgi:hypothetical protein
MVRGVSLFRTVSAAFVADEAPEALAALLELAKALKLVDST